MGQSTDAIVAYGWASDDQGSYYNLPWANDDDTDYEDALARQSGLVDPWTDAPTDRDDYADYGSWRAAHPEWAASLDAYREAVRVEVAKWECRVGTHCSCDYPMLYVCITESEMTTGRGSVGKLDPQQMVARPKNQGWDDKLRAFVDHLGIDVSELGEPGWFVVSDWC